MDTENRARAVWQAIQAGEPIRARAVWQAIQAGEPILASADLASAIRALAEAEAPDRDLVVTPTEQAGIAQYWLLAEFKL